MYYYSTSYSTKTLTLREKSSFYHSPINGEYYSHYSQSSLYSLPRNPRFLLYGYLLRRYVPLEPSRTFQYPERRVRLCDGGSYREVVGLLAEANRCCRCCCCSKGDNLGFNCKKPTRKKGFCSGESKDSEKILSLLSDFECSGAGRRRGRVVGEPSSQIRRNGCEFDGVGMVEKDIQEVQKYEDDANLVRDSRKEPKRKGSDGRVSGHDKIFNLWKDSEKSVRKKGEKSGMVSSFDRRAEERGEYSGYKMGSSRDDVERISNSQRRFEEVSVNDREDLARLARGNRTQVNWKAFDKMESDCQYGTQTDVSRVHAGESRRASGMKSAVEIRADERRAGHRERYSEEEQIKDRVNRRASVENVIQVAREKRTQVDRQEFDNMESTSQLKSQTDISRIHASNTQGASSRNSSLEIRANDRRSDDRRRYSEEEQMKNRESKSTLAENIVLMEREKRNQVDRQEFDKMESDLQYKSQTNISRNYASNTERESRINSSLEIRADDRRSDNSRRYFEEEQMEERENRSTSVKNVVQVAGEKRTLMDRQEFDKIESDKQNETRSSSSRVQARETHRASSSRSSVGIRTDDQEDSLSSAAKLVHRMGERWTMDTERDSTASELERSHTERVSNLQEISDTRIEKQKETSSSLLVREKDKQRRTVTGESSRSTQTQVGVDQSLVGHSSSLYQTKNDAIESASRLDKSSASYVSEFVDKLRQEIATADIPEMNTETARRRKTNQSMQQDATAYEEKIYTEEGRRHSSSRSGVKGPSDEMWEVRGTVSSQEPSKVEEPEEGPSAVGVMDSTTSPGSGESAISRRSHRSLWTYIAGIIKLGWGRSAQSHNLATKRSARSSSNESIGSEAWFSGNEQDENEDAAEMKGRKGSSKDSVLMRTPVEQTQAGSSTSVGILRIGSSSKHASLESGEYLELNEAEKGQEGIVSGIVGIEQAAVLIDDKSSSSITETGNSKELSGKKQAEVSGTEGNESELKRRVRSQKAIMPSKSFVDQMHPRSSTSTGTVRRASTFQGGFLVSRPEDVEWSEGEKGQQGAVSDVVTVEQPPAFTVGAGSSLTAEIETVEMSESGSAKLEEVSGREKLPEVGGTEGKDSELKRRKFQRNKQVLKEQFEEWEEAYILESEQRKIDEFFMREALLEAKNAAEAWEVPVGAVLVQNGKVIARGCNLVEELRDSTAHAEMICIREASNLLRTWRLADTTLYVTLEPCAMCAGAILQARIDTVVWGAPNKLLGADGSWVRLFPSAGGANTTLDPPNQISGPIHPFHPKINIRRGVLATECSDAMQQFFQLRRKKNKKEEQSPPPPCLPVSNNPTKLFTKLHNLFCMMFCL